MDLNGIRDEVTKLFCEGVAAEEISDDRYRAFAYPKHLKMMRFDTKRYRIPGYGHLFTMFTNTIFGMKLLTCSFMPGEGVSVPYLLIDMMTVGKKRTVFVEYYDCTADRPAMQELKDVAARCAELSDYAEKPAWYVGERTEYSLIKTGKKTEDDVLTAMVRDSVATYRRAVTAAARKEDTEAGTEGTSAAASSCAEQNRRGLLAFRERMVKEGNPSSSVMNRVFGPEGAEEFFRECVMPM